MPSLARCAFCDGPCLARPGICSNCLRLIGRWIQIAVILVIALGVGVVTWIMMR